MTNRVRHRARRSLRPRSARHAVSNEHRPSAVLNGRNGREILRLEAKSGSVVELDACDSNDANEDAITYEWFVYGEAGTHRGEVSLASASGPRTQFTARESNNPKPSTSFYG